MNQNNALRWVGLIGGLAVAAVAVVIFTVTQHHMPARYEMRALEIAFLVPLVVVTTVARIRRTGSRFTAGFNSPGRTLLLILGAAVVIGGILLYRGFIDSVQRWAN